MWTYLSADAAVARLHRHGAGRWGVPLAVLVAIAMAVGVSVALAVNRIDDGTAAAGSAWLTVTSAHAVPSSAGPSSAVAGR